jgi:hypothetical protein
VEARIRFNDTRQQGRFLELWHCGFALCGAEEDGDGYGSKQLVSGHTR